MNLELGYPHRDWNDRGLETLSLVDSGTEGTRGLEAGTQDRKPGSGEARVWVLLASNSISS